MADWLQQLKPRTKIIGAIIGVLAIAGIGVGSYFAYNTISASTPPTKQKVTIAINNWDLAGQKYFHDTFGQNEKFSCSTVDLYIQNSSDKNELEGAIVAVIKESGLASGAIDLTTTINKLRKENNDFKTNTDKKNALANFKRTAIVASSWENNKLKDYCNRGGAGGNASADYSLALKIPVQYQATNAQSSGGSQTTSNEKKCIQNNGNPPTYFWVTKQSNGTWSGNGWNLIINENNTVNNESLLVVDDSKCNQITGDNTLSASAVAYICVINSKDSSKMATYSKTVLPDKTFSYSRIDNVDILPTTLLADSNGNLHEPGTGMTPSNFTYAAGRCASTAQATIGQMILNVSAVNKNGKPVPLAEVFVVVASDLQGTTDNIDLEKTDSQGKATITLNETNLRKENGNVITQLRIYANRDLRALNKPTKQASVDNSHLFLWAGNTTKDIKMVFSDMTDEEASSIASYAAQPPTGSQLVLTTLAGSNFPTGNAGFKVALAVPSQVEDSGFTMAGGGRVTVQGCFTNEVIKAQKQNTSKIDASVAYAADTINITGKVRNQDGTPATKAAVQIKELVMANLSSGKVITTQAETGQDGKFKLSIPATYQNQTLLILADSGDSHTRFIVGQARNQDIGILVLPKTTGSSVTDTNIAALDNNNITILDNIERVAQAYTWLSSVANNASKSGDFSGNLDTIDGYINTPYGSLHVRGRTKDLLWLQDAAKKVMSTSDSASDVEIPNLGTGTAPTGGFTFTPPYASVVQPFYKEGEESYDTVKKQGSYNKCDSFTINFPDNGKNSAVIVKGIAEGLYKFSASKNGYEGTTWWALIKKPDTDLKMLPIIPTNSSRTPPSIVSGSIEKKVQYGLDVYKAAEVSKCTKDGMDAYFISEYPWYGWQCAKEVVTDSSGGIVGYETEKNGTGGTGTGGSGAGKTNEKTKKIVSGYVITRPAFNLSRDLYGMPGIPPRKVPQVLGLPPGLSQRAQLCASTTSVGFGGVKGDILLAIGAGYLTGSTVYDAQKSSGASADDARTNGYISGALAAYSVYKGGNVNISQTQIQQCFGSLQPQVYDPGQYCQSGSTDPYCQIYAYNPTLASRYLMNTNPGLWLRY